MKKRNLKQDAFAKKKVNSNITNSITGGKEKKKVETPVNG